ncbi:MAG: molybdopterin-dependent oxidoreductase [Pseudomonadota bacterium]|nr:molybdopterin-dependent oxidoreductase [Pseudomonadota bacterium]
MNRSPRVGGLRVLSRRNLLVGAAAAAGVVACDDAGKPQDTAVLGGALTPVTANDDFYVTSSQGNPEVDSATWALTIRTGGEIRATLDLAWLEGQAGRDREHTLECIGANPYSLAIGNAVWTGLPLHELLTTLGVEVPEDAVEMVFTGADTYTTSLPVADLDRPVWLVWRMNGEPLPFAHGYPARLLVPGRYGMKNPKWITDLSFSTTPYLGYWESHGWSNEATYKPNALVQAPVRREVVEAGPARILGMAFAGTDPVTRVDVRIDGGDWQEATLDYAPGADVWTLWHFDWEAAVGARVIQARCTTLSGATSLEDPDGSLGLEGYDGSMEVEVEVA